MLEWWNLRTYASVLKTDMVTLANAPAEWIAVAQSLLMVDEKLAELKRD